MSSTDTNGVRTMDEAFAAMLDADTHAENINPALRRNAPMPAGPSLIPVARYTDRRYHELEKERLWSRVWQVAAHEDDFEHVGDVQAAAALCMVTMGSDQISPKAHMTSN